MRYASSQPWAVKVSSFFFRLGYSESDTFGRFVYGLFLLHKVAGLPEVDPKRIPQTLDQIGRLPMGYGGDLGRKALGLAVQRARSRYRASEVLSIVTMKLAERHSTLLKQFEGKPVKEAETYVLSMIRSAYLDLVRRDRNAPFVQEWAELQETTPSDMPTNLNRILSQEQFKEMVDGIARKVSPELAKDIPEYLELIADGYSDRKIVNNKMLPFFETHPMTDQGWTYWRKKMLNVLKDVMLKEDAVVTASNITQDLVQSLVVKTAKDFSSPEAMRQYLRDHPGADARKHHVVKEDGGRSSGGGTKLKVKDKQLAKELADLRLPAHGAVDSVRRMLEDDDKELDIGTAQKAIRVLHDQANNPATDKDRKKKLETMKDKLKEIARVKEAHDVKESHDWSSSTTIGRGGDLRPLQAGTPVLVEVTITAKVVRVNGNNVIVSYPPGERTVPASRVRPIAYPR
jgi:hypothetical protein